MREILLVTSSLWLGVSLSYAQVPITGNLQDYISAKISALPSSGENDYADPDDNQLAVWEESVNLVLTNKNILTAHTNLASVGYQLVAYTHTGNYKLYYIIEKTTTGINHWGSYVIDPSPCRSQLVIQSPHPKYDSNTGLQGIYTFLELEARAFFLSGTHRCNSTTASGCSGSTSACGSSAPYKMSDPAHNSSGMFQKTTEMIMDQNAGSIVIQLHGFGKDSGDPNAIISNGTRITPETDYIGMLTTAMIADNAALTFKVIHEDLDWTKLTAFTNTQGRYINGSFAPCTNNATGTMGQFIHIEQELAMFRSSATGWALWIGPMLEIFACQELELEEPEEPEELGETLGNSDTGNTFKAYPNPTARYIRFQGELAGHHLLIWNAAGVCVLDSFPSDWSKADLEQLPKGVYMYRVLNIAGIEKQSGKLIKSE